MFTGIHTFAIFGFLTDDTEKMKMPKNLFRVLIVTGSLLLAGCVQRTMVVTSSPPGALVYMNDKEMGRTPFKTDFTWYGDYDVQVRLQGYQTLKTVTPVSTPFWQYVPLDLLAELMPWHPKDERHLHYTLIPTPTAETPTDLLVHAGEQLKTQLESTRIPTTQK